MFGFGTAIGKDIGTAAANTALRTFVTGLLENGLVIAPLTDLKPEARTAALARTTLLVPARK